MTDKKPTDNEIIRAMECCGTDDFCNHCKYQDLRDCHRHLAKDALDFITRQQTEIDDLERIVGLMNKRKYYRKFVDEVFSKQKGKELSEPDFDYIYQLYFEQQSEIERLKDEYEESKKRNQDLVYAFQSYKSEAYKEFADNLANGIIVLPCKVGAEIFGVFDNDDEQRKEIYEGKVLCFSLDENNLLWARMRYKNGLTYWHTIDDFGKTVFLTKEEAEEKLKELGK